MKPRPPIFLRIGHVKCWRGKDRRYYCCPEHADFGLEKAFASVERLGEESVMRRCDYCGGKLGLIIHRKWRWRFCSSLAKRLTSTASARNSSAEDDVAFGTLNQS